MFKKKYLKLLLIFAMLISCNSKDKIVSQEENLQEQYGQENHTLNLKPWQEGFLDIHHINTGNGDTSFLILPDGTTMLFDAGIIHKERFEKKYNPLKASTPKPNDSMSAAQWTALYIKNTIEKSSNLIIDYGLVSHFHEDHYGSLVELARKIPIKKIIDRNYPDYDFPLNLKKYLEKDTIFHDYLSFLEKNKIPSESLIVGSNSQIKLQNSPNEYANFKIQNVKSNGTIWTGKGNESFEYFTKEDITTFYKGKYNENPLSLALKISYGNFDYFTGGDNTGLQGFGLPKWFDVETPMAKAVGEVEVTTLNHHGNRDATNEFFVNALNPKVVVQQSWCSDHPGQEVYQRLIYKDKNAKRRDIFATNMHDETLVTYGPWFKKNYKSMHGHIVIRVHPKGEKYEVIVLNDNSMNLEVKEKFGPYKTN